MEWVIHSVIFRPNVLDGREKTENWDIFSRRDGVLKFSGEKFLTGRGAWGKQFLDGNRRGGWKVRFDGKERERNGEIG